MSRENDLDSRRSVALSAETARKPLFMSLVIPTYRRPDDLSRCLAAMEKSFRLPDEFLIVCRPDDFLSRDVIAKFLTNSFILPIKIIDVLEPGLTAALIAGLEASIGDVVCFTDDDAAPHQDWLQKIEECYQQDASVVGVGGRDLVHTRAGVINDPKTQVGIISPFGRLIGNHHLGVGKARVVDVLKGVNMSYKGDLLRAIKFDRRLKGTGAQVHNELALGLAIRGEGRKLVYDPAILVDHYPAERFDEDARGPQSALALSNATFNLFFALLGGSAGWNRLLIWQWYQLVGTSTAPGLLQICRSLMSGDRDVIRRWRIVRAAARDANKAVSPV
ncbi:glycosyltransferase family 2 protein [Robbsia sp. Bb-Pol-6]|uniref:Glycosyltransferase family 2 protein n=1 Tax=Robbsia betulipollinis TaxID=2981849 RepID=A0ABT3ZT99_9BURK|nr:glycosyltransferase family 2 protein [Robbsia betulipollinis]MCY0389788.1 glycosyltransferase family 2 protein [Robbsia betulipollinis]